MSGEFMEEYCTCCVCGTECEKEQVKQFERKGKTKNICKECVAAIKGLA
jgi:hypothetical protein